MLKTATIILALGAVGTTASAAQDLARRVAAVKDGAVRMSFATQEGVCGSGDNISMHRGRDKERDWTSDCKAGPALVQITKVGGHITRIKTHVGGRWLPRSDATDLGTVSTKEAVPFLLGIAKGGGDAADDAIFPTVIADSVTVWPELLALARNENAPRKARKSALFWVGQEAAEEVTKGLQEVAEDEKQESEIRKSAVFALSQRPKDQAVPALIKTARTAKDPQIRKSAVFWLGQSDDPRAVEFFEEILAAKR